MTRGGAGLTARLTSNMAAFRKDRDPAESIALCGEHDLRYQAKQTKIAPVVYIINSWVDQIGIDSAEFLQF